MLKTMWTQFWAAHQRFFKYMCVAAKVFYNITSEFDPLLEYTCNLVIGLGCDDLCQVLTRVAFMDLWLSMLA